MIIITGPGDANSRRHVSMLDIVSSLKEKSPDA